MKQSIVIKPYDSKLPDYYKKERDFLVKNLGRGFEIQHVGSSAVPGLGGKNIVDIQLLAPNKRITNKTFKKLESIGYSYSEKGGDKYRMFFSRERIFKKRKVRIFLHLMWKTSNNYKNHLMFRDYLRKHPDEAKRYYSLKKMWAKKAGEKRKKYTKMKTDYIKGVLKKAKLENK